MRKSQLKKILGTALLGVMVGVGSAHAASDCDGHGGAGGKGHEESAGDDKAKDDKAKDAKGKDDKAPEDKAKKSKVKDDKAKVKVDKEQKTTADKPVPETPAK